MTTCREWGADDIGPAWFAYRENTNDYHVLSACYLGDEYQVSGMGPGDVAIDIGAHIGGATVRLGRQGVRVYAFEPVLENYELLYRNVRQNGLSELVTCYQEAVVGEDGPSTVYLGAATDMWHHWIAGVYMHTEFPRDVRGVSLNTIIEREDIERYDLLKLDAEGAEWEILESASWDTLARIDCIVGEYHTADGIMGSRARLLELTRGLFEDVTGTVDAGGLGPFRFKRGQL